MRESREKGLHFFSKSFTVFSLACQYKGGDRVASFRLEEIDIAIKKQREMRRAQKNEQTNEMSVRTMSATSVSVIMSCSQLHITVI